MNTLFTPAQQHIIDQVQVNIPFSWLCRENWLDLFISSRINPEIGLDAAALDTKTADSFSETAALFHQHRRTITLHGPFIDLSPGSTDPAILGATRQRLEQMLSVIEIFTPATVVCHAGYDGTRYGFIRDVWLEECVRTWKWLGEALFKKGTRLMLENVYEKDPSELLEILCQLDPDHVGCCLDVGHLTAFGNGDLRHWIDVLSPRIGQIHLHDNPGDADRHLGMGEGGIDFRPIRTLLAQSQPPPVITLEPHTRRDLLSSIDFLEQKQWFSP